MSTDTTGDDRYADTVYRFIYFRVNDRGLAEDFTSETFLRALRRIGSISYQGRDIGAWFVTIARNIVLDHLKSARHRLETTTADTIEGREHAQSTEAAVLDTLQSERLMQAVSQLGDEQRLERHQHRDIVVKLLFVRRLHLDVHWRLVDFQRQRQLDFVRRCILFDRRLVLVHFER